MVSVPIWSRLLYLLFRDAARKGRFPSYAFALSLFPSPKQSLDLQAFDSCDFTSNSNRSLMAFSKGPPLSHSLRDAPCIAVFHPLLLLSPHLFSHSLVRLWAVTNKLFDSTRGLSYASRAVFECGLCVAEVPSLSSCGFVRNVSHTFLRPCSRPTHTTPESFSASLRASPQGCLF